MLVFAKFQTTFQKKALDFQRFQNQELVSEDITYWQGLVLQVCSDAGAAGSARVDQAAVDLESESS